MATSPRSDKPRLDRAEGLWTLFGAGLLVTFLSYVVVSGGPSSAACLAWC